MIVSLHPRTAGGRTSRAFSGVERELQHAFEHTKEVYVVWKPKKKPEPVHHRDGDEDLRQRGRGAGLLREAKGMFGEKNLFGH
jgi:adenylate kinase